MDLTDGQPPAAARGAGRGQAREEDIRRRAIEATRALAAEGGYESVQMRDVVRMSGLSSATIYRHFSSKDHLLAATHLDWIKSLERSRAAARPGGVDAADRVAEIIADTCRAMSRKPRLAEALIHALGSSDPGVRDCHRETNRIMHDMFRAAVADEVADVDEFIRLIGVAWEGALFSWAFGRMSMDDVELVVRRSARLLIAGAAAEQSAG